MKMQTADSLKRIQGAWVTPHWRPAAPGIFVAARKTVLIARQVYVAYAAHRRAIRSYHQLMRMPDYMLRDLGLVRSEIMAARQAQRRWFRKGA